MNRLLLEAKSLARDALRLYWVLLKVMVPVMLLVRLAVELGAIEVIGAAIAPVMGWVGLPGEMGFVWVTAMLVNIYAGAAALLTLLPAHPLSVAQATVLGAMILIAHSLPLEQRIAQRAGAGLPFTTALRLAGALAYGMLLHHLYAGLEVLGEPARVVLLPLSPPASDWAGWALHSLDTLLSIFWIILALLAGLRLLDLLRITALLAKALSPCLRLMGIGETATAMTMAGALLGLSYGGILIIREARSGTLPPQDIFLSLAFLCLCHSLLEDTLFVMALGGHYSGLLLGRFAFALLVTSALAKLVQRLPAWTFRRYLCHPV